MHPWIALWAGVALATPPDAELRAHVAHYVADEAAAEAVIAHAHDVAARSAAELAAVGGGEDVAETLIAQMTDNLGAKVAMDEAGPPLPMSAADIRRTVIDYEGFKLRTHVTSGVFPKRYFGYFDRKYDTAADELRLALATSRTVEVLNDWLAERGYEWRVTDAEVAVTFIAEGGALWLREHQDRMDALHPVEDVGLDDIAKGVHDLPDLMADLDAATGTGLSDLVAWVEGGATVLPEPTVVDQRRRWVKSPHGDDGPYPYLRRFMTLEEAVAGTGLMWVWEKEIAARKLAAVGAAPLEARSPEQQFIIGSLVYNSGKLHTSSKWTMIEDFSSGEWMWRTSEANATSRWRLSVLRPPAALSAVVRDGYPDQPTAWLAVYHVLQRYGAYAALMEFTDVFDDEGAFRTLIAPSPPEARFPGAFPQ